MDPELVEKIVQEIKSQGIFDMFRKDSIADVDTKPAYQNLKQRVDTTVVKFLSEQKWKPEMNKNQLREKLRRHITESGFLDVGVERIVDQVVNPKIGSVFQPRIEEIAYKLLGIPQPPTQAKYEAIMTQFPPLPSGLQVETGGLLPTDLEQVSPDSDMATGRSETKSEHQDMDMDIDMDVDDDKPEDDEESPPFEPLVRCASPISRDTEQQPTKDDALELNDTDTTTQQEEKRLVIDVPDIEETILSQNTPGDNQDSEKESRFAGSQDAEMSQVSSESRISSLSQSEFNANGERHTRLQMHELQSPAVNMSEEAQMPKFNENSTDGNGTASNVAEDNQSAMHHFDIKKDEIKFEGTARKAFHPPTGNTKDSFDGEQANACDDNQPAASSASPERFVEQSTGHTPTPPPSSAIGQESTFDSSLEENGLAAAVDGTPPPPPPQTPAAKEDSAHGPPPLPTESAATDFAPRPPSPPPPPPTPSRDKDDKCSSSQHSSSSSSSRHKKHDKDKEKTRSGDQSDSRDRSKSHQRSSSGSSSSKRKHSHSSSSSSKHSSSQSSSKNASDSHRRSESSRSHHSSSRSDSKRSDRDKDRDKDKERGRDRDRDRDRDRERSRSDRDKKHHSSSSQSGSSRKAKSETDKSSEATKTAKQGPEEAKAGGQPVADDHNESKKINQRRRSDDSNDGSGKNSPRGSGGPSSNGHVAGQHDAGATEKSNGGEKEKPGESGSSVKESDKCCLQQQQQHKVVILNDLLENPDTHFIDLAAKGKDDHMEVVRRDSRQLAETHLGSKEKRPEPDKGGVENESPAESQKAKDSVVPHEDKVNSAKKHSPRKHHKRRGSNSAPHKEQDDKSLSGHEDLLYFEGSNKLLCERITVLEQVIESSSSDSSKTMASGELETPGNDADVDPERNLPHTPPKRFKLHSESDRGQLQKPSPTPSDISSSSSNNSKENVVVESNVGHTPAGGDKLKETSKRSSSMAKLSRQQRYSSEDLYKPRPVLGQRSRRRGLATPLDDKAADSLFDV